MPILIIYNTKLHDIFEEISTNTALKSVPNSFTGTRSMVAMCDLEKYWSIQSTQHSISIACTDKWKFPERKLRAWSYPYMNPYSRSRTRYPGRDIPGHRIPVRKKTRHPGDIVSPEIVSRRSSYPWTRYPEDLLSLEFLMEMTLALGRNMVNIILLLRSGIEIARDICCRDNKSSGYLVQRYDFRRDTMSGDIYSPRIPYRDRDMPIR
jgi:hypothetical protein